MTRRPGHHLQPPQHKHSRGNPAVRQHDASKYAVGSRSYRRKSHQIQCKHNGHPAIPCLERQFVALLRPWHAAHVVIIGLFASDTASQGKCQNSWRQDTHQPMTNAGFCRKFHSCLSLARFEKVVALIFRRSRAATAESQRDSNHSAQGCEEQATLGERTKKLSTRNGLHQSIH